jgi:hypothetical protein
LKQRPGDFHDLRELRRLETMINVGGDPDLEHARCLRPYGAATVDEVLLDTANLGDVVMGRDERLVGEHKVHLHAGIGDEHGQEFGDGHHGCPQGEWGQRVE